MTSSEKILRAAFNRVKARLKDTIISSMKDTTVFIQDAPVQIKKEWEQLKVEIINEANRIEDVETGTSLEDEGSINSQNKIDQIRLKIKNLTKQIEEIN